MKLEQDNVLMEKFRVSHWEPKTEANLVLMKDQVWFYQVDPFSLLGCVTLRVQGLERLIIWVTQKELDLAIK